MKFLVAIFFATALTQSACRPTTFSEVVPRTLTGLIDSFWGVIERAEWNVIAIKMVRVLVDYFIDLNFEYFFGKTGASSRNLPQSDEHDRARRSLKIDRVVNELTTQHRCSKRKAQ